MYRPIGSQAVYYQSLYVHLATEVLRFSRAVVKSTARIVIASLFASWAAVLLGAFDVTQDGHPELEIIKKRRKFNKFF